jgi:hypothetical protein
MKRRDFLTTRASEAAGASLLLSYVGAVVPSPRQKRIVLLPVGVRGISFWGKRMADNFSDTFGFVSRYDINPKKLDPAKLHWIINCLVRKSTP